MNKYPKIAVSRLRMEIDGDGVTTLVVSYGCTLRCKYCLNPYCFEENTKITWVTAEELIEELKIDDLYFRATKGGVVFGGGEPLLQAEFIHEFRGKCPKEWRIYLETALNVPRSLLELVEEDVDDYIIDCKDWNTEIYEQYTGQNNQKMRENLAYLLEKVGEERITVRVPLIPEYNTIMDCEQSEAALRTMGFTKIDRFTYDKMRGYAKKNRE